MSIGHAVRAQTWAARSRGWIGILLLAPVSFVVLFSAPRSLEGSWQDFAFDTAAWFLFMAGAGFRWWSTLYIGGRKTFTLVTDGPYSLCRNPIYLGTFLMGMSVAAFLESLTFALGLGLVSWFYLSTTVPVEERRLRGHFGEAFDNYCREVPRFLPRLRGFHSSPSIQVELGGLVSEGRRMARWIWIPIICGLIVQMRSQPTWPHFFHLP